MRIGIHDTQPCEWCGMECFDDELNDVKKCYECIKEECHHKNTYIDYCHHTRDSSVFNEHCIDCKQVRQYRFYFHTKTQRIVGPWTDDEC